MKPIMKNTFSFKQKQLMIALEFGEPEACFLFSVQELWDQQETGKDPRLSPED